MILQARWAEASNAELIGGAADTTQRPDRRGRGGGIPSPVKRHLGLDDRRSWVVVTEGNEFVWPGYGLRKFPHTDRFECGFLPPRFFRQVLNALIVAQPRGPTLTPRD
jgi:hypothetical protein